MIVTLPQGSTTFLGGAKSSPVNPPGFFQGDVVTLEVSKDHRWRSCFSKATQKKKTRFWHIRFFGGCFFCGFKAQKNVKRDMDGVKCLHVFVCHQELSSPCVLNSGSFCSSRMLSSMPFQTICVTPFLCLFFLLILYHKRMHSSPLVQDVQIEDITNQYAKSCQNAFQFFHGRR